MTTTMNLLFLLIILLVMVCAMDQMLLGTACFLRYLRMILFLLKPHLPPCLLPCLLLLVPCVSLDQRKQYFAEVPTLVALLCSDLFLQNPDQVCVLKLIALASSWLIFQFASQHLCHSCCASMLWLFQKPVSLSISDYSSWYISHALVLRISSAWCFQVPSARWGR